MKQSELLSLKCLISKAVVILYDLYRYFDDLTPILSTCSCLACRSYTRSYIHHLLVAKELLAPVLLTM